MWERILDFSMWPKVVDNVVSARVYSAEQRAGGERELVVGVDPNTLTLPLPLTLALALA